MTHICLNMLTKNSGAVLRRSLESVLAFVESYVIVDASSTDNTLDEVTRTLGHLPGEVHGTRLECLSDGFSASRNFNLAKTRDFLCKSDNAYILYLDAGEQLGTDGQNHDLTADAYCLNVVYGGCEFPSTRIFRACSPWLWKYRVHEACFGGGSVADLPGVEIFSDVGNQNPDKYRRYARLSELDLVDYPDDPRATFYAAQNWYACGEYRNALDRYTLRATQGGYWEEVWYAHMRCGMCFEQMGDHEAAAQCYVEAHEMNPGRAEPARHLARMLGSAFWADVADQIPCPASGLFVECDKYQYTDKDEVTRPDTPQARAR